MIQSNYFMLFEIIDVVTAGYILVKIFNSQSGEVLTEDHT